MRGEGRERVIYFCEDGDFYVKLFQLWVICETHKRVPEFPEMLLVSGEVNPRRKS